jgi:hypothetical protein
LLFGLALAVCAQSSAASSAAEQGVQPLWDVRVILKEIAAHAGRLLPPLNQIDAKSWASKGAPDTYVKQVESCKAQAKALSGDALALAQDPDKLSLALQTFFRMQGLEFMLRSLDQGIRKYQSPALADMLNALIGENGVNRERLQSYIIDLASQHEQQFKVMDSEAQRCRAFLAQQTPPRQPRKRERK